MCEAAVFSRQVIWEGCALDGNIIFIQRGRYDISLDHFPTVVFVLFHDILQICEEALALGPGQMHIQ